MSATGLDRLRLPVGPVHSCPPRHEGQDLGYATSNNGHYVLTSQISDIADSWSEEIEMSETCCGARHLMSEDGISYRFHETTCPVLDEALDRMENYGDDDDRVPR
jgi:hypothetical protein